MAVEPATETLKINDAGAEAEFLVVVFCNTFGGYRFQKATYTGICDTPIMTPSFLWFGAPSMGV